MCGPVSPPYPPPSLFFIPCWPSFSTNLPRGRRECLWRTKLWFVGSLDDFFPFRSLPIKSIHRFCVILVALWSLFLFPFPFPLSPPSFLLASLSGARGSGRATPLFQDLPIISSFPPPVCFCFSPLFPFFRFFF